MIAPTPETGDMRVFATLMLRRELVLVQHSGGAKTSRVVIVNRQLAEHMWIGISSVGCSSGQGEGRGRLPLSCVVVFRGSELSSAHLPRIQVTRNCTGKRGLVPSHFQAAQDRLNLLPEPVATHPEGMLREYYRGGRTLRRAARVGNTWSTCLHRTESGNAKPNGWWWLQGVQIAVL